MNVTIKLDQDLCRQARHRAVDRGMSLSAWMADLLERELSRPHESEQTPLIDSLSMQSFEDREFAPERSDSSARDISF